MRYFKPDDPKLSAGDCIPFAHDGVFHLYYLLDEGHHNHPIVGGFGGHQWAHASSRDLKAWTHHPLAIPCDYSCEGSICTGSPFFHDGVFHAFYALRPYPSGGEFLRVAKSLDGISFEKGSSLSFGPPECFGPDFRDPFVFKSPDGAFQMLVTTKDRSLPKGADGCLLRLSSSDLASWRVEGPFLKTLSSLPPECPDLFEWNGWHYLLFGVGGATCYRMSRSWNGPWLRPANDVLDAPTLKVMKSAPWKDGRRVAAGWVSARGSDGSQLFGGRVVFRELLQLEDGTLGTACVPEMEPEAGPCLKLKSEGLEDGVSVNGGKTSLDASSSPRLLRFQGVPESFMLKASLLSKSGKGSLSIVPGRPEGARWSRRAELDLTAGTASLNGGECKSPLPKADSQGRLPFELVVEDGIMDLRVGGVRTLANCLPGPGDGSLSIIAAEDSLALEGLSISELRR